MIDESVLTFEQMKTIAVITSACFALMAMLWVMALSTKRCLAKAAEKAAEKRVCAYRDRLVDGIDTARPGYPRESRMSMDNAMKTVGQIMTDMGSVRAEARRYSLTIADQREKREVYALAMEGKLRDEKLANGALWEELFEIAKITSQANVKRSRHDRLKEFLKVTMRRIEIATDIDERLDKALVVICRKKEWLGLYPQQKVVLLLEEALRLNEYATMYMKEHDRLQATIREALARRLVATDYRHNNETILDALVAEMDCDADRLLELRNFMKKMLGEMEGLGLRGDPADVPDGFVDRDPPADPAVFNPASGRSVRGGEPEEGAIDPAKTVEIRGQGHRVMPTTDPNVIEIVDVAEADPESLGDGPSERGHAMRYGMPWHGRS